MTNNFVPFQPNVNPDGSLNANAGKDDAILYGATKPDPGGLPLGTLEYLTFNRFYNAPGVPFTATLNVKAPAGTTIPAGTAALNVPAGWTVDAAKPVAGGHRERRDRDVQRHAVGRRRGEHQLQDLGARGPRARRPGYTDQVVRVVSPVEGRFQRWGNWAEYDNWLENTAPAARRLGRSAAIQTTGVGETFTLPGQRPQLVRRRRRAARCSLTLPANVTADATSKPYTSLAPGADTTVNFTVSNTFTNATLPTTANAADSQSGNVSVRITTTYGGDRHRVRGPDARHRPEDVDPRGGGRADDGRRRVRRRVHRRGARDRPQVGAGRRQPQLLAGRRRLRLRRRAGHRHEHLRQGHPLRRRPVLLHPRQGRLPVLRGQARTSASRTGSRTRSRSSSTRAGNASQVLKDTANTFKLGDLPVHQRPGNTNGNGANGPCWSRDADNHQGFSTGPLAATVSDAPNAPGVIVQVDGDVGRLELDDRRPRLRRRGRLQPRGQDPDGGPAGGGRPEQHGPEHHALRRGRHLGRGHDHAAPHRP